MEPAAEALLIAELREMAARHQREQEDAVRSFLQRLQSSKDHFQDPESEADHSVMLDGKEKAPVSPPERSGLAVARVFQSGNTTMSLQLPPPPPHSGNRMHELTRWWHSLEEPIRRGKLFELVYDWKFELLTLTMILLNGALLVVQTDRAADTALYEIDYPGATKPDRGAMKSLEVAADYFFTFYFLTELILKLIIHKLWFFGNRDMGWNVFEFAAVSSAVVEILVQVTSTLEDGGSRFAKSLQAVRIFRVLRVLRVLRALHAVKGLRMLLGCMLASFRGLFWCVLLLAFLTCAASIFLVQSTAFHWQDRGTVTQETDMLMDAFGSVWQATISLFKATTSGADWGYYYDLLLVTGWMGPLVLALYMLFFIIAAWNVVTGLFVESALELAAPDAEARMFSQLKEKQAEAIELMRLLESVDEDGSGTISMEEFKKWMEVPRLQHFLEVKGVDVKDAELFFRMMKEATNTTEIELSVLANGLLRMRGLATNMDLQAVQFSINHLYHYLEKGLKEIRARQGSMAAEV